MLETQITNATVCVLCLSLQYQLEILEVVGRQTPSTAKAAASALPNAAPGESQGPLRRATGLSREAETGLRRRASARSAKKSRDDVKSRPRERRAPCAEVRITGMEITGRDDVASRQLQPTEDAPVAGREMFYRRLLKLFCAIPMRRLLRRAFSPNTQRGEQSPRSRAED
jgi:hypothetical protein